MVENSIFDEEVENVNDWKKEWKGMPECNNTDILPFKQLIINFKDKADYEKKESQFQKE
jgi:hypothetical protein